METPPTWLLSASCRSNHDFAKRLRPTGLSKSSIWIAGLVAFQDLSYGKITSWKWDFGDGKTSTEQHPVHTYEKAGEYVVTLYVEGPDGKARRAKVWDVVMR